MSRWSAYGWSAHASGLAFVVATAVVACAVVSGVLLLVPASAGTPGMSVKVTPNHGLVNGQTVRISGHGLPTLTAAVR